MAGENKRDGIVPASTSSTSSHARPATAMDAPIINDGDTIEVGNLQLKWGQRLLSMRDSTHLLADPVALAAVIAKDGYALLRGVIPRYKVLAGRRVVIDVLDREWSLIDRAASDAAVSSAALTTPSASPTSSASSVPLTTSATTSSASSAPVPVAVAAISSVAPIAVAAPTASSLSSVAVANESDRIDAPTANIVSSLAAPSLSTDWPACNDGHIRGGQKGMLLTGFTAVTHHPNVKAVLEGTEISTLFGRLFNGIPATFDNKWVRVMGRGESTDEHTDYYRFEGCAQGMYTCWVAFGDYNPKQGTLAVCEGSHLMDGYRADYYGVDSKVELPPRWDQYNENAIWRTESFNAGDMVVFDIRTVHASTTNITDRFRISMDTRWQPASYVPMQSRKAFRSFPSAAPAMGTLMA